MLVLRAAYLLNASANFYFLHRTPLLLSPSFALPLARLRTSAPPLLELKSGVRPSTLSMSSKSDSRKAELGCESSTGDAVTVDAAVGIEAIRADPSRLDSMTVKDLRELTRSVGIPARGNKKELVSALRCFSLKAENADEAGDEMPPAVSPARKKTVSRNKDTTLEDDPNGSSPVSQVSKSKQKRSRRNQQLLEATVLDENTTRVATRQELSVETEEATGRKRSRTTKKVSSKVQLEMTVVDQVGLPLNGNEPWTTLAHKKPQVGWIPYNPRTMRPPPLTRDTKFVKLVSWNVNGLRALLKLEGFSALELAQKEDFDVLCLQETKIQDKDVQEIKERLIKGYDNSFWTCSISKLGYSGTAIISRFVGSAPSISSIEMLTESEILAADERQHLVEEIKPISVKYGLGVSDHDSEGRLVTLEFDTFYLISGYVPNSGDGLRRLTYRVKEWDPSLSNYMKDLEKSKPVILTGDLNCAHEEIDIYNPAGNRRSAGFTNEERESFELNFLSKGFVDTFRRQHPGVVAYTYWGYRHGGRKTNKGWRLDYFLVSDSIADRVHDSYVLPEVIGSDHCPIGLVLKL